MATGKSLESFDIADVSGGCNYSDDISAVTATQSPDSMNVEFFNGRIRKRKGVYPVHVSAYAYDDATSVAYDAAINYDYGLLNSASVGNSIVDFSDSRGYHKQVVHFNSTISAYDRLRDSATTLRSNAPTTKSFNTKASSFLVQSYNDYSAPYYWDGLAASMAILSPNAPNFKRSIEFQGYLIGMNTRLNPTRCYYQPIGNILGAPAAWDQFFTLTPAPNDDEISDSFILNGRLYTGTKYSIFRVSFVGGITVFEFKQVISNTGIVPGTVQTVITQQFGQVAIFLGTDKRVYMFDGAFVRDISKLYYYHNQTTPIAMDLIDDNYKENSFAVFDSVYRIYRLFVTRVGDNQNKYCLNIDVDTFAYYPFDNMTMSAGCMCFDNLLRPFLVCINYQGQILKMFVNTSTDFGTPINEYYTSPLVSKASNAVTQGKGINLRIPPSSDANLQIYDRVNHASTWELRQKIPLCSPKDKTLGTSFVLNSSKLGSDKMVLTPMISINVTFNFYQFMISCDRNTATAWEIYDMSVDQAMLKFGQSEPQR